MSSAINEETFVDFKCPHCGAMNSYPSSASGVVRECLNCLDTFLVPDAGESVGRKLPLPFDTPKIHLRRFRDDDWKDLLEFEFSDEVEATNWLKTTSEMRLTDRWRVFHLAIEMRSNGKVVGFAGLNFTDDEFNQVSFSSSHVAENYGMEIALAANDAALGFCFQGLGAHRVEASCNAVDLKTREL